MLLKFLHSKDLSLSDLPDLAELLIAKPSTSEGEDVVMSYVPQFHTPDQEAVLRREKNKEMSYNLLFHLNYQK